MEKFIRREELVKDGIVFEVTLDNGEKVYLTKFEEGQEVIEYILLEDATEKRHTMFLTFDNEKEHKGGNLFGACDVALKDIKSGTLKYKKIFFYISKYDEAYKKVNIDKPQEQKAIKNRDQKDNPAGYLNKTTLIDKFIKVNGIEAY